MFAKSAIFQWNDILGLYLNRRYNSLSWQLLIFDNRAGLLWNILAYKTRFVVSPKKSFCWNPLAHIWHLGRGPAFEMAFVWKRQWQLYFTKCCFVFFFPLDAWILYFSWILHFAKLDLSGFTPSVESVPSFHHSWTSWPITCHLSTRNCT